MLLKVLRSAVRGKANYIFEGNTKLNNTPALKKSRKMANADATQPAKRQQDVNSKPTLRKEKLRQANKNKSTPYIPGTVTLQVLGSGSNGAPASVYLFTDQSRYLFNCGEGTQRLAHEHKTKLARLEQIFVTRNTWPAIGGFPGLALTVQDAGVKELSLHGPPFLENILISMKRFVVLKNLQVRKTSLYMKSDHLKYTYIYIFFSLKQLIAPKFRILKMRLCPLKLSLYFAFLKTQKGNKI